jgi:hypothetical protein
MEELKKLIQAGNHKLPKSTAIFNMASATDCPSLKLGLCSAVDENGKLFCYAKKSEAGYRPDVLPYRRKKSFGKQYQQKSLLTSLWQLMLVKGKSLQHCV